jgi:hypothetical protein
MASVTIQTRRECRGEADGRWSMPWLVARLSEKMKRRMFEIGLTAWLIEFMIEGCRATRH